MPRQSRHDRLLADREAALIKSHAAAIAAVATVEAELTLVRDLRHELSKVPKRPSRAKRSILANTQPPTATAA